MRVGPTEMTKMVHTLVEEVVKEQRFQVRRLGVGSGDITKEDGLEGQGEHESPFPNCAAE